MYEPIFLSLLLPSLELSDTQVCEPQIRTLLGTASHFCEVVVNQLSTGRDRVPHVGHRYTLKMGRPSTSKGFD